MSERALPQGKRFIFVDKSGNQAELNRQSLGAGTANIEIVDKIPSPPSADTLYLISKVNGDDPLEQDIQEIHAYNAQNKHAKVDLTNLSSGQSYAYRPVSAMPEVGSMNENQVYCEIGDWDDSEYTQEIGTKAWFASGVIPEATGMNEQQIYFLVT